MDHMRRFGIYSVIGSIALLPLLVLPAMIGVLVDGTSLSEAQAGWSASLNFLGGALVAFAMALRMHRLDLRRTAAIGFLLAALGDLASAYTGNQPGLFMVIRFVTGVGAGAAYTATLAAFARLPEVERGYALFVTLQFTISGLGLYLLPVYSTLLGPAGMYLAIAALDIAGIALTVYLPGRALVAAAAPGHRTELHVLLAAATLLGAFGFLVFEAANTAQFTYVERLGVSLRFTDQQIGTALLLASFAGIPGAFSILLLGNRIGRMAGLAVGITLSICGLGIMIFAQHFAPYVLGTVMIGFSWAFCLPYIQGLMASLDPHGSAIAAGSASSTIGGAIGPGLAALVIGSGEYHHVFLFAIGLLLLALTSLYFAGLRAACPQPGV